MATGTTFLGDRAPQLPFLARSGSLSSNSTPSSPQPQQTFVTPPPSSIPPIVSLELRVRWLEALVLGLNSSTSTITTDKTGLLRKTEDVQRHLDQIIEENEGLRRFTNSYDEYEHLLTPSFALSPSGSSNAPSYEDLSPSELDAFLLEMEPDLRAADRDLREIQALDKRGVTGAGKLADHESLKPRLKDLVKAQQEDLETYRALENRVASLLQRYSSHVNALSELFVLWNDSIREAEDQAVKLEKDAKERRKLAFDSE